ncbi:FCD domain-containing protein [Planctomicrobium sp. SH661]|uniref:GntR family transcriptional regulator n=1 Tax=Planctomicrobium sp. SH661 TaxID=3448124 RepID=UPI003F5C12AB
MLFFMSIASYIKDDLAVRLQTGRELPQQLTLDSLAEMYNVSFTPIRAAVAELIDEGLLAKGPNRRLVANSPVKKEGSVIQAAQLPEPPRDPFDVISRDLIQMSLEGVPLYLREEVTAEKYGVSRSMIRNVLHRLAGEGILDHIPRRGWRLRPFRQVDLQSYVEVRESLELTALNLSLDRLDPAELQRLLDLNVLPEQPGESLRIDESLHTYLIETANNSYIKEFFERQGRYYRLLFQWEDHEFSVAVETIRQHREILTALLNRDWAAARAALSFHILKNHPILTGIEQSSVKSTDCES